MLTKQNANFHIIMTSKEKFNQNYGRIDIIFNTFQKKTVTKTVIKMF